MKKLFLLSLILLSIFSCRKDVEELVTSTTTPDDPVIVIIDGLEVVAVNATLFGVVVNENDEPISNAVVVLENNTTTTTDSRGRFLFKDQTMNQAGTIVTVTKAGYFHGSDRFFPQEGSTNYSKIILLEKVTTGSFVSSDGSTITAPSGLSVFFRDSSIVDANGDLYNGTVNVAMRWLNPTEDRLDEMMPGGLQGFSTNQEVVALVSYGMAAVELEGENGEPLNILPGATAKISFPLTDNLIENAPSEIPLWSFNETAGIWIQESTAFLDGAMYVGEVGHFSWWNCDDPYTLIDLSGTLVTENDSAYAYQSICLELVSTGEVGCIYANQDGFFSGQVPMNQEFILTVSSWNGCDFDNSLSMNIGPFSSDTDLGTLTVGDPDLSPMTEVNGSLVDCSANPLSEGWVELTLGSSTHHLYLSDGNYNFSFYNCDNLTELTVQATNLVDLQVSDAFTYSITNPLTIPSFAACGTQLTEWLRTIVDGDTTTFFVEFADIYGMGDSISIYAFDQSTGDSNVNIYMEGVNGTGTYDGSQLIYSSYSLPTSTGGYLNAQCQGANCVFDELIFTEFGANSGDHVQGNYSGTIDFSDPTGNVVTHLLEVEFRVQRN